MKNKCNKISDECGAIILSSCVSYEGETNELSPLKDDCALSVEEVLDDVYTQLEEINLSALGENCLDYILDDDNKIIVKNVLLKYEEEICILKQQVADLQTVALCETDITSCDFEWGTLTDACGDQPTTFKAALQLIIDTIQP